MAENDVVLRFEGASKRFPGVLALSDVAFDVRRGSVHALVGENGAGKSTLIKILTGVHRQSSGRVLYNGADLNFNNPHEALLAGITAIYQELNLVPTLTVAENVFLGHPPKASAGTVDWRAMRVMAGDLLKFLEVDIDPGALVRTLGVARKQVVEIAKALSMDARVIIMDEPTAAIPKKEIDTLFRIIRTLRERGVTIIYISHHLDEVFTIADAVTVLRDGRVVDTMPTAELDEAELIRLMVGRELTEQYPYHPAKPGAEALRVEGLARKGVLKNISFSLRAGEVVGVSGMVGSGRTELLRAIYGVDPVSSGSVYVGGAARRFAAPRDAIEAGIALLPEERKTGGLVLLLSVMDNIGLPSLKKLSTRGVMRDKDLTRTSERMRDLMNIKTPSLKQRVMNLSGGNQQKVVLGKWFARDPKVYLFDEPTRGIDVGAKVEIYNLMNRLKEEGAAILMVSSELPEILGMSDRVLVMREGEIAGELGRGELSQERVLKLAIGGESIGRKTAVD
ncbi:MAG: sugar ABC transporter ATP-binding protein [Planctomycetota bacterium]|jgi:ribose transport system ATP-binding protein|nr:sugar ABC transporter ATP-binding protein [Planctomycetota bacterium]